MPSRFIVCMEKWEALNKLPRKEEQKEKDSSLRTIATLKTGYRKCEYECI